MPNDSLEIQLALKRSSTKEGAAQTMLSDCKSRQRSGFYQPKLIIYFKHYFTKLSHPAPALENPEPYPGT